jgi:hypothetical protein
MSYANTLLHPQTASILVGNTSSATAWLPLDSFESHSLALASLIFLLLYIQYFLLRFSLYISYLIYYQKIYMHPVFLWVGGPQNRPHYCSYSIDDRNQWWSVEKSPKQHRRYNPYETFSRGGRRYSRHKAVALCLSAPRSSCQVVVFVFLQINRSCTHLMVVQPAFHLEHRMTWYRALESSQDFANIDLQ